MNAYEQGRAAYLKCIPEFENPYRPNSENYKDWERVYANATEVVYISTVGKYKMDTE